MGSLHKNIQLMLAFLKSPSSIGLALFPLNINELPDDVCNFAICADNTALYSNCDEASDQ